jgi:hypothetical protein
MNSRMKLCSSAVAAIVLVGSAAVTHGDEHKKVDKPTDVVDRVRKADPPVVSTTTKPSPVGQKTTDYHPTPKTKKPLDKVAVPAPPKG